MNGWERKDHEWVKLFFFSNFVYALTFMTRVASLADNMEHHPWWEKGRHSVRISIRIAEEAEEGGNSDTSRTRSIDELYESMPQR